MQESVSLPRSGWAANIGEALIKTAAMAFVSAGVPLVLEPARQMNKIMYVYLLTSLSIFKVGIDYNLRPDKSTYLPASISN